MDKNFDNINSSLGIVFVPKTGSTYLSLNPLPIEYYVNDSNKIKLKDSIMPGSQQHMSLSFIRKIIGFNLPIFTVVRNPYDRTCSEYFFIKSKGENAISTFKNFNKKEDKLNFLSHYVAKTMVLAGWGTINENVVSNLFYEKAFNIYKYNMSIEEYLEWSEYNPTYPIYYDISTPKEFDCVGLTEEMNKTIYLLKLMYGITVVPGNENKNINKKVNDSYKTLYSEKKFKKNNEIEYEMYFEGKEKFLKLWKTYDK